MKTSFVVYKGKKRIKGRAFLPSEEKNLPALIISHEFAMNMLSTARYARRLYRLGYAVFIFDFCGSGAGISDGKSTEMSVLTEKEDLNCVLDYVQSLDFVDKDRITLMGCSQGGLVSALLAAERETEIEKLILCYPALSIPDDARHGTMLGAKEFPPDRPPEKYFSMYVRLGRKYVEDAQKLDPWREICSFSKPVFIIHGDRDGMVPYSYAKKADEKYPNSVLARVHGGRHMFPLSFPGAAKAIGEFLLKK